MIEQATRGNLPKKLTGTYFNDIIICYFAIVF